MPPYFIVLLTEGFVFLEYQRQHSYLEAKYCKCVYFPHNLVFPNSSERTEIVLSLFTHCRPLARMHFSWFSGNTTGVCLYFSLLSEAQQGLLYYSLFYVYSCIEVIIPNPLLWVASLITAHVFSFYFPSLFTGKLSIATFVVIKLNPIKQTYFSSVC